jgi:hypothetical protein
MISNKILIMLFLLISTNVYSFGDFLDAVEDVKESIEDSLPNQGQNNPNPKRNKNSNIPSKTSNNDQIELKETPESKEVLGVSNVNSFEHKALGIGLNSGDVNKFNSKAFAILSAVNKIYKTRLYPNTEFAKQLINNPNYGVIKGYQIISEIDEQPTRMGQPKNPAQGKWSYKIKVDVNNKISKEVRLKIEKDQRTLYVKNIDYIDCNTGNSGMSEAEAIQIALNTALISYHELKTNRRNLLPGNSLQKKWLSKEYGLIESYEVLESSINPFLKIPVVKLKIVLANPKYLPNADQIKKDIDSASPLNPVAEEYDKALNMRIEATKHYESAFDTKKLFANEQELKEEVLHLGSPLGDTGNKTIVFLDNKKREKIVKFLATSPEMSPAALKLLDKGKQKDIVAEEVAKNAPLKINQVQKTGCEDIGFSFTYFERQIDVAAEKNNVVAALDYYYANNAKVDGKKELQLQEGMNEELLRDEAEIKMEESLEEGLLKNEAEKEQPKKEKLKAEDGKQKLRLEAEKEQPKKEKLKADGNKTIVVLDDKKREKIVKFLATTPENPKVDGKKELQLQESLNEELLRDEAEKEQPKKEKLKAEDGKQKLRLETEKDHNNPSKTWIYRYTNSKETNGTISYEIKNSSPNIELITSSVNIFTSRKKPGNYDVVSIKPSVLDLSFYEVLPYLNVKQSINLSGDQINIKTLRGDPLSMKQNWNIEVEKIKSERIKFNGEELNSTKFIVEFIREACSFGAFGRIKAELIYLDKIDRIYKQKIKMFGCSLNGSASDYGSSELTLIDSDDEVKNKNGWEEKSN